MRNSKNDNALPIAELSQLGLYESGKHLLTIDDISALLSGRRTSLVNLRKLSSDDFVIESLDAKLSLGANQEGINKIKLHPIYREPKLCADLEPHEAWAIIAKEAASMTKVIHDGTNHTHRTVVFEFDSETREFVSYDPINVQAPIEVNGERLDGKQQEGFAYGKIVKLSDGTKIQHRASEPKGIIADRTALIITINNADEKASILLENLSPLKDLSIQRGPFTEGFETAFLEIQKAEGSISADKSLERRLDEYKSEYSRGYSHGLSR